MNTKKLIEELNKTSAKEKVNIWFRVAKELEKPARLRREVNLCRINVNTKEDETIIVPGKVLSVGELDHKVNVAALSFSQSAMDKINKSGKAMKIQELLSQNPKGSKVRIIG